MSLVQTVSNTLNYSSLNAHEKDLCCFPMLGIKNDLPTHQLSDINWESLTMFSPNLMRINKRGHRLFMSKWKTFLWIVPCLLADLGKLLILFNSHHWNRISTGYFFFFFFKLHTSQRTIKSHQPQQIVKLPPDLCHCHNFSITTISLDHTFWR